MCRHVGLDKDGRDFRIDPDCQIDPRKFAGLGRKRGRILGEGNRVQVNDAKETLVFILQPHPVAQRTQIVSQMDAAGWLDAAEDSFHCGPAPKKTIEIANGMTILKTKRKTPVNIATINSRNPKRSSASIPGSKLDGRMLCNTLLPSSGGIGKRLKTPRATFNVKNTHKRSTA